MKTNIIQNNIQNTVLNIIKSTMNESFEIKHIQFLDFTIHTPITSCNITYYPFKSFINIIYTGDDILNAWTIANDVCTDLKNNHITASINKYSFTYFAQDYEANLHIEIYGVAKEEGIC